MASYVGPRPRWWFLITPRWLAWHAFAVAATFGMLWLGDWQLHRAESGNALSWAYTFEWPIFTIFGVVFWAKTIVDRWKTSPAQDEPRTEAAGQRAAALSLPPAARAAATMDDLGDEDDQELAAYNDYLARLGRGQRVPRFP